MTTKLQQALEELVYMLDRGSEFPNVVPSIALKFKVPPAELEAAYDKLPTSTEIHNAFQLMEKQGGSFAQHLAEAWFCADSDNQKRILKTWPDLVEKYVTR